MDGAVPFMAWKSASIVVQSNPFGVFACARISVSCVKMAKRFPPALSEQYLAMVGYVMLPMKPHELIVMPFVSAPPPTTQCPSLGSGVPPDHTKPLPLTLDGQLESSSSPK